MRGMIMTLKKQGGERENELKISVIIPLLNALDDLPELLEALSSQSLSPGSYEIVLVDDGSTDGSLEWLAWNPSSRVRVFSHQARRGSYAARNLGLTYRKSVPPATLA